MIHTQLSLSTTLRATLSICLALVFILAPAGLAQAPLAFDNGWSIYLPMILRDYSQTETGFLDTTFSGDGWAMVNFSTSDEIGYALAVQPDGKVIVAGAMNGTNSAFALARYNPDGSLDTTFSGDGNVITNFPSGYSKARAVVLQPDGKIVVAGEAYEDSAYNYDIAVARYNPDGSLDTTFSGDGMARVGTPNQIDRGRAVTLQADGKIVVAGQTYSPQSDDFALARLNPDGSLDTTFVGDGLVVTDFGDDEFVHDDGVNAIAVQPADGKIVVAGSTMYTDDIYGYEEIALARYNPNGSLDTSFSGDGKVLSDVGTAEAMLLQPDGAIIVVGYAFITSTQGSDFSLARFDTNGRLNTYRSTDFSEDDDMANAIALQEDGKLVVAGESNDGSGVDFALARYDESLIPDPSFGDGGKLVTDFGSHADQANAVGLKPDGKIIAAGSALNANNGDFALAQYLPDGSLDGTFSSDGMLVTEFAGSPDIGQSMALQPDGKIVLAGYVFQEWGFTLARLNPDGSLDASFDGDGKLKVNFALGVYDVLVQPDGKIVAAGHGFGDFALARFNPDGSLDTGFSEDGTVLTDAGSYDTCRAVLLQPDGKIIAAGTPGFTLVRYNPDGSLDTTFDDDGIAAAVFPSSSTVSSAALQGDGKIVLAGTTGEKFALARFNPDGSLDTSFDGDGLLVTDLPSQAESAYTVGIKPGGEIVAAGMALTTDQDFVLVQYNPDGSLDTTFSGDGMVITDLAGDIEEVVRSLAFQTDGKIVVAGCSDARFALARFNPDGSLDTTYSSDGFVISVFANGPAYATDVALQPDGMILVAGYASNGTDYDFTVARYK